MLFIKSKCNHTIYKNHFVRRFWAVCGCVRVCDMSLEPSRPPDEDLIGARLLARAARPQCVKMHFYYISSHVTAVLRLGQ